MIYNVCAVLKWFNKLTSFGVTCIRDLQFRISQFNTFLNHHSVENNDVNMIIVVLLFRVIFN